MITTKTPWYRDAPDGAGYDVDVGETIYDVEIAYIEDDGEWSANAASRGIASKSIKTATECLNFIAEGRKFGEEQ